MIMEHASMPRFSSIDAIKFAFTTVWRNPWLFVKLGLMRLVLSSAFYFFKCLLPILFGVTLTYDIFMAAIFTCICFVLIFLAELGLDLGYAKVSLMLYDTGRAGVKDIFLPLNTVSNYFRGSFLAFVLIILGLLLLIVPGIVMILNFFFFDLFIVDQSMMVWQSFAASKKLVYGSRLRLAGFILLSLFAFLIFYIITFGIGLIFATPLVILARVYVYRKLLETQHEPQEVIQSSP